jgi:hypothetical protein
MATNKNITWTSGDTSIATVTNGEVRGVKEGSTTITVTTEDGGKTAACTVNVNPQMLVTGVSLNKASSTLASGSTETLTATVLPSNASNKEVTWASDNNTVATVSNGTVRGVNPGMAEITVTTNDGGYKETCVFTVYATGEVDIKNLAKYLEDLPENPPPANPYSFSVKIYSEEEFAEVSNEISFYSDTVFVNLSFNPSSKDITEIHSFDGLSNLVGITIPAQITTIYDSAFASCENLERVTMQGITSIGEYAFNGCSKLVDVTIPNTVRIIGDSAFSGCASLKEITLPQGVTNIGKNAFSTCEKLVSVTIPSTVTIVEDNAFDGCKELATLTFATGSRLASIGPSAFSGTKITSVTVPDSVKTIGSSAFSLCASLENVTIGSGITETIDASIFNNCAKLKTVKINSGDIGGSAFKSFKLLTSLEIGSKVTSIGGNAFEDCSSLTGTLYIGADVTIIGANAFKGTAITGVNFGASSKLTSIGVSAFEGCASLASSLTIPASVTSIGKNAFKGCGIKGSVSIGANARTIDESAFEDCAGITRVDILIAAVPTGAAPSIGTKAFKGCTSLATVVIGDGIKTIGDNAFEDCPVTNLTIGANVTIPNGGFPNFSLKTLTFNGPTGTTAEAKTIESTKFKTDALTNLTLSGKVKIGDNAFKESFFLTTVTIQSGSVVSIGNNAFKDSALTSFNFANVTSIGDNAFESCSLADPIAIPDTVTSIGSSAFKNSKKLTTLNINAAIAGDDGIKGNAFENCLLLKTVNINAAAKISDNVFKDCKALETVNINANAKEAEIGKAFSGCEKLKTLNISSAAKIKDEAFVGCAALETVTISAAANIGTKAFDSCKTIKTVTVSNSNNATGAIIGDHAFASCEGITKVSITCAARIDGSAFEACKNLTDLTITSVKQIGNNAFKGCDITPTNGLTIAESVIIGVSAFDGNKKLTKVTFGNSVKIGEGAFANCEKLANVTIGTGVTIGKKAFNPCDDLATVAFNGNISKTNFSNDDGEEAFQGDLFTVFYDGADTGNTGTYKRTNTAGDNEPPEYTWTKQK